MTNRHPSSTKSGPGRFHKDGTEKAPKPKRGGAGFGFVQHTTDKARRDRRAMVKEFGIRQVKRFTQWSRPDFKTLG